MSATLALPLVSSQSAAPTKLASHSSNHMRQDKNDYNHSSSSEPSSSDVEILPEKPKESTSDMIAMLLNAVEASDGPRRKSRKGIPRKSAMSINSDPSPTTASTGTPSVNTPDSNMTPTEDSVSSKRRRLDHIPSLTFASVDKAVMDCPWKLIIWNEDVILREEKEQEKEAQQQREAQKLQEAIRIARGEAPTPVEVPKAGPYLGPPDCILDMIIEHRSVKHLDDVTVRTVRRSLPEETAKAPHVSHPRSAHGEPLKLDSSVPYFDDLTKEEAKFCQVLRISPTMYMFMKDVFLTVKENNAPYRRADTKKWFRLDVTKTAKVFDWFKALGWVDK